MPPLLGPGLTLHLRHIEMYEPGPQGLSEAPCHESPTTAASPCHESPTATTSALGPGLAAHGKGAFVCTTHPPPPPRRCNQKRL